MKLKGFMGKLMRMFAATVVTVSTMPVTAFAAETTTTEAATGSGGADFDKVASPIIDLINSIINPMLGIVGALGAVYCIILGVKFAKAEEQQEREKAKSHLKNAIIGFVLIFVLMVVLKLAMPALSDWANNSTNNGTNLK